jgi:outer membrane protein assembly factor BamB
METIPKALKTTAVLVLGALLLPVAGTAEVWTHWRGPHQTGVSGDTGLPSEWSKEGKNLIWRDDFSGRSTPVVVDGRVCATGRAGEDIHRQEMAACWDAGTGEKLWERRWTVYLTTVPWNRVSWAAPAADVETGYLFMQGVDGHFVALDQDGNTVWEWRLFEDLGRFSGYGGRTNTPIVDGDRVVAHVINSAWGPHRPAGDRFIAFDKRTGEILWMTPRNGPPAGDLNTYSTPVVAELGGQRLLIGGGADGWVRAVQAATGEDVWDFRLSQRGLNSSVVVGGDLVYAAHSEENLDEPTQGRLVAIDGTGRGDVTKTHERWRVDQLLAGYASPALHGGVLYLPDNSAHLHAFDAASGDHLWAVNYGTVGKGSPVWADGKIYVTEVNGNFVILKPGPEGAETLDVEHLTMPSSERYAEIYASPAIAYDRIYFTTEEGIYCLGDKDKPFRAVDPKPQAEEKAPEGATPALLRVVPGVTVVQAGDTVRFRVRSYDDRGRLIGETTDAGWTVGGLPGSITGDGVLTFDAGKISGAAVGTVTAKVGELEATAHLRVAGALPWSEDFDAYDVGGAPAAWLGLGKGATVQELDGEKVLAQPKAARGAPRATILMAPALLSGYTLQADVRGNKEGRRYTDMGIVNSGYTFEIQGAHQRIQVSSWSAERRMARMFPFEWQMGVWYTLKMRVDYQGEGMDRRAIVRGKVWRRDQPEPAAWTVEVEDPHPILHGSPGLYTFAPVESYFDNVRVTQSE